MTRGTVTYRAKGGRVIAYTPEWSGPVSTALGSSGFHLERFEKALSRARAQSLPRPVAHTDHDHRRELQ